MQTNQFTRRNLHQLIWSKTLSSVASDLGIEAYLLSKICKTYYIPTPDSGYWMKLAFGKEVYRKPLIEFEKWKDLILDIKKLELDLKNTPQYQLKSRIKEIEQQCPEVLKVSQKLVNPHALVAEAKRDLNSRKSINWRGYEDTINTFRGFLNIEVTKQLVPRMLRIVDRFIKLLEKRGHSVKVTSTNTIACINGENFEIAFREKSNRRKVNDNGWNSTVLVPNGILSIKLCESYKAKEWKDGHKVVELQLAKVVAALELRAEKKKADRTKWEKRQAELERLRELEEKEAAKKEMEAKRIGMLQEHAANWNKALQLQAFIQKIESEYHPSNSSKKIDDWIAWAKLVELSMNPLTEGLDVLVAEYDLAVNNH